MAEIAGFWRRSLLAAALFAAVLGACTSSTDTPEAIARVAVSPSLEGAAADRLRSYSETEGVPEFDLEPWLEEAALESVESGELALMISGRQPPQGWFATPLWTEGIAVVVNAENPRRALTTGQLADLFRGTTADWQELQGDPLPVMLVVPFPGDSLRTCFESLVLDGASITPAAALASSASDVVAQVEADPGAIGILAVSQVTDAVRPVRVEGVIPSQSTVDDGRYLLRMTVLAAAPTEPAGSLRDWLAWLQRPAGSEEAPSDTPESP